ncbi:hypothetical protein TWF696_008830 [Orbilia brochopaga]|uniref:Uncharacterized protein n=1 Tax=Orbilia brochopaga TaxID=3140254 RepID=A0AAV9UGH7_9PEZI
MRSGERGTTRRDGVEMMIDGREKSRIGDEKMRDEHEKMLTGGEMRRGEERMRGERGRSPTDEQERSLKDELEKRPIDEREMRLTGEQERKLIEGGGTRKRGEQQQPPPPPPRPRENDKPDSVLPNRNDKLDSKPRRPRGLDWRNKLDCAPSKNNDKLVSAPRKPREPDSVPNKNAWLELERRKKRVCVQRKRLAARPWRSRLLDAVKLNESPKPVLPKMRARPKSNVWPESELKKSDAALPRKRRADALLPRRKLGGRLRRKRRDDEQRKKRSANVKRSQLPPPPPPQQQQQLPSSKNSEKRSADARKPNASDWLQNGKKQKKWSVQDWPPKLIDCDERMPSALGSQRNADSNRKKQNADANRKMQNVRDWPLTLRNVVVVMKLRKPGLPLRPRNVDAIVKNKPVSPPKPRNTSATRKSRPVWLPRLKNAVESKRALPLLKRRRENKLVSLLKPKLSNTDFVKSRTNGTREPKLMPGSRNDNGRNQIRDAHDTDRRDDHHDDRYDDRHDDRYDDRRDDHHADYDHHMFDEAQSRQREINDRDVAAATIATAAAATAAAALFEKERRNREHREAARIFAQQEAERIQKLEEEEKRMQEEAEAKQQAELKLQEEREAARLFAIQEAERVRKIEEEKKRRAAEEAEARQRYEAEQRAIEEEAERQRAYEAELIKRQEERRHLELAKRRVEEETIRRLELQQEEQREKERRERDLEAQRERERVRRAAEDARRRREEYEAHKAREREIERRKKEAEDERLRQEELERQRQIEEEAAVAIAAAEAARLAELERQRHEEEERQAELERQRQFEIERQRQAEIEQKRLAEEAAAAEAERARLEEIERLRQLEIQRQREARAEAERLAAIAAAEAERVRQAEILRRQEEAELARKAEEERIRLQRIAEEKAEHERRMEIARQRAWELEQQEIQRREEERIRHAEFLRQQAIEAQRIAEEEERRRRDEEEEARRQEFLRRGEEARIAREQEEAHRSRNKVLFGAVAGGAAAFAAEKIRRRAEREEEEAAAARQREVEEQQRRYREEQERIVREEQERIVREEQDRIAREEQDRIAREEWERAAREEQERIAREEIEAEERALEERRRSRHLRRQNRALARQLYQARDDQEDTAVGLTTSPEQGRRALFDNFMHETARERQRIEAEREQLDRHHAEQQAMPNEEVEVRAAPVAEDVAAVTSAHAIADAGPTTPASDDESDAASDVPADGEGMFSFLARKGFGGVATSVLVPSAISGAVAAEAFKRPVSMGEGEGESKFAPLSPEYQAADKPSSPTEYRMPGGFGEEEGREMSQDRETAPSPEAVFDSAVGESKNEVDSQVPRSMVPEFEPVAAVETVRTDEEQQVPRSASPVVLESDYTQDRSNVASLIEAAVATPIADADSIVPVPAIDPPIVTLGPTPVTDEDLDRDAYSTPPPPEPSYADTFTPGIEEHAGAATSIVDKEIPEDRDEPIPPVDIQVSRASTPSGDEEQHHDEVQSISGIQSALSSPDFVPAGIMDSPEIEPYVPRRRRRRSSPSEFQPPPVPASLSRLDTADFAALHGISIEPLEPYLTPGGHPIPELIFTSPTASYAPSAASSGPHSEHGDNNSEHEHELEPEEERQVREPPGTTVVTRQILSDEESVEGVPETAVKVRESQHSDEFPERHDPQFDEFSKNWLPEDIARPESSGGESAEDIDHAGRSHLYRMSGWIEALPVLEEVEEDDGHHHGQHGRDTEHFPIENKSIEDDPAAVRLPLDRLSTDGLGLEHADDVPASPTTQLVESDDEALGKTSTSARAGPLVIGDMDQDVEEEIILSKEPSYLPSVLPALADIVAMEDIDDLENPQPSMSQAPVLSDVEDELPADTEEAMKAFLESSRGASEIPSVVSGIDDIIQDHRQHGYVESLPSDAEDEERPAPIAEPSSYVPSAALDIQDSDAEPFVEAPESSSPIDTVQPQISTEQVQDRDAMPLPIGSSASPVPIPPVYVDAPVSSITPVVEDVTPRETEPISSAPIQSLPVTEAEQSKSKEEKESSLKPDASTEQSGSGFFGFRSFGRAFGLRNFSPSILGTSQPKDITQAAEARKDTASPTVSDSIDMGSTVGRDSPLQTTRSVREVPRDSIPIPESVTASIDNTEQLRTPTAGARSAVEDIYGQPSPSVPSIPGPETRAPMSVLGEAVEGTLPGSPGLRSTVMTPPPQTIGGASAIGLPESPLEQRTPGRMRVQMVRGEDGQLKVNVQREQDAATIPSVEQALPTEQQSWRQYPAPPSVHPEAFGLPSSPPPPSIASISEALTYPPPPPSVPDSVLPTEQVSFSPPPASSIPAHSTRGYQTLEAEPIPDRSTRGYQSSETDVVPVRSTKSYQLSEAEVIPVSQPSEPLSYLPETTSYPPVPESEQLRSRQSQTLPYVPPRPVVAAPDAETYSLPASPPPPSLPSISEALGYPSVPASRKEGSSSVPVRQARRVGTYTPSVQPQSSRPPVSSIQRAEETSTRQAESVPERRFYAPAQTPPPPLPKLDTTVSEHQTRDVPLTSPPPISSASEAASLPSLPQSVAFSVLPSQQAYSPRVARTPRTQNAREVPTPVPETPPPLPQSASQPSQSVPDTPYRAIDPYTSALPTSPEQSRRLPYRRETPLGRQIELPGSPDPERMRGSPELRRGPYGPHDIQLPPSRMGDRASSAVSFESKRIRPRGVSIGTDSAPPPSVLERAADSSPVSPVNKPKSLFENFGAEPRQSRVTSPPVQPKSQSEDMRTTPAPMAESQSIPSSPIKTVGEIEYLSGLLPEDGHESIKPIDKALDVVSEDVYHLADKPAQPEFYPADKPSRPADYVDSETEASQNPQKDSMPAYKDKESFVMPETPRSLSRNAGKASEMVFAAQSPVGSPALPAESSTPKSRRRTSVSRSSGSSPEIARPKSKTPSELGSVFEKPGEESSTPMTDSRPLYVADERETAAMSLLIRPSETVVEAITETPLEKPLEISQIDEVSSSAMLEDTPTTTIPGVAAPEPTDEKTAPIQDTPKAVEPAPTQAAPVQTQAQSQGSGWWSRWTTPWAGSNKLAVSPSPSPKPAEPVQSSVQPSVPIAQPAQEQVLPEVRRETTQDQALQSMFETPAAAPIVLPESQVGELTQSAYASPTSDVLASQTTSPAEFVSVRPKTRAPLPSEIRIAKIGPTSTVRSDPSSVESPLTPRPRQQPSAPPLEIPPTSIEEPEEPAETPGHRRPASTSSASASASGYGDDDVIQPPSSPALSTRSTRSVRHPSTSDRGRRVSELQSAGDMSRDSSLRERRHSRHSVVTVDSETFPSSTRDYRSRYSTISDPGAHDIVRYAASDTSHTPASSIRDRPKSSRKSIVPDEEALKAPSTESEKSRHSSSRHSQKDKTDKEDNSLLSPSAERSGRHKEHKEHREHRHRSRSRDTRDQGDVDQFDDAMSVMSVKTDRSSRHKHRDREHKEHKEHREHRRSRSRDPRADQGEVDEFDDAMSVMSARTDRSSRHKHREHKDDDKDHKGRREHREHKEHKEHKEHRDREGQYKDDDTASMVSEKSSRSRHRHRDSETDSLREHRYSAEIADDTLSVISSSSHRSSRHHKRHHSHSRRHEDDRADTRTPVPDDDATTASSTRDGSPHRHHRSVSRDHRHKHASTVAGDEEPDVSSHRESKSHHRSRSSVSTREPDDDASEKRSHHSRTSSRDIGDYGSSRLTPVGIATASQSSSSRRVGSTDNPDLRPSSTRESTRHRRPSISSILERREEERAKTPTPTSSRSRPLSGSISDRTKAFEDSSAGTAERPQLASPLAPTAQKEQEQDQTEDNHPVRSSLRKSVPNARNLQQLEEEGSRPVNPFFFLESPSPSSVPPPLPSDLPVEDASQKPFMERPSHSPARMILDVRPRRKRDIYNFLRTFNASDDALSLYHLPRIPHDDEDHDDKELFHSFPTTPDHLLDPAHDLPKVPSSRLSPTSTDVLPIHETQALSEAEESVQLPLETQPTPRNELFALPPLESHDFSLPDSSFNSPRSEIFITLNEASATPTLSLGERHSPLSSPLVLGAVHESPVEELSFSKVERQSSPVPGSFKDDKAFKESQSSTSDGGLVQHNIHNIDIACHEIPLPDETLPLAEDIVIPLETESEINELPPTRHSTVIPEVSDNSVVIPIPDRDSISDFVPLQDSSSIYSYSLRSIAPSIPKLPQSRQATPRPVALDLSVDQTENPEIDATAEHLAEISLGASETSFRLPEQVTHLDSPIRLPESREESIRDLLSGESFRISEPDSAPHLPLLDAQEVPDTALHSAIALPSGPSSIVTKYLSTATKGLVIPLDSASRFSALASSSHKFNGQEDEPVKALHVSDGIPALQDTGSSLSSGSSDAMQADAHDSVLIDSLPPSRSVTPQQVVLDVTRDPAPVQVPAEPDHASYTLPLSRSTTPERITSSLPLHTTVDSLPLSRPVTPVLEGKVYVAELSPRVSSKEIDADLDGPSSISGLPLQPPSEAGQSTLLVELPSSIVISPKMLPEFSVHDFPEMSEGSSIHSPLVAEGPPLPIGKDRETKTVNEEEVPKHFGSEYGNECPIYAFALPETLAMDPLLLACFRSLASRNLAIWRIPNVNLPWA